MDVKLIEKWKGIVASWGYSENGGGEVFHIADLIAGEMRDSDRCEHISHISDELSAMMGVVVAGLSVNEDYENATWYEPKTSTAINAAMFYDWRSGDLSNVRIQRGYIYSDGVSIMETDAGNFILPVDSEDNNMHIEDAMDRTFRELELAAVKPPVLSQMQ